MPILVIQNSCVAGAMAGLMAQRYVGSVAPTNYAAVANAARAIADEFIIINAASGAPIDDTDNGVIGPLVLSCAMAAIVGSGATSVTPADYLTYGRQIYASVKQGLTKLV